MADRLRRALLLLWRMAYPLLIYLSLTELVIAGYGQMASGNGTGMIQEDMFLPLTAAGALLASVPLGHIYIQQRMGFGQGRPSGGMDRRRRMAYGTILCVLPAGVLASLCFNNLMRMLPISPAGAGQVMGWVYKPSFGLQVICTVFLVPLAEELVFRGLCFWQMRRELPFWAAAFFSSVYFGLYHGNLYQGAYACILGFLLACLFEWTDSLFAAWVFHAAANLASVTMNAMGWDKGIFEYVAARVAIVTLTGLLLAFLFYKIREDGKKSEIIIHSDTLL